jgi:transcriptional regulator with XRE-family HTH domain
MLGKRIEERRKALGLSQEQLAGRVGTRQSHLSRIERGFIVEIQSGLLTRLAQALDVTTDWLLGLTPDEEEEEHLIGAQA